MNGRQKTLLLIASAVILSMVLFPPWEAALPEGYNTSTRDLGYHFVLTPPTTPIVYGDVVMFKKSVINIERLLVQLIAVVLLTTGGVFMSGNRQRKWRR
jgi:hypothetical protein